MSEKKENNIEAYFSLKSMLRIVFFFLEVLNLWTIPKIKKMICFAEDLGDLISVLRILRVWVYDTEEKGVSADEKDEFDDDTQPYNPGIAKEVYEVAMAQDRTGNGTALRDKASASYIAVVCNMVNLSRAINFIVTIAPTVTIDWRAAAAEDFYRAWQRQTGYTVGKRFDEFYRIYLLDLCRAYGTTH